MARTGKQKRWQEERVRGSKRQGEKITKAITVTMKRAIQKGDSVDGATKESGNACDGI